MTRTNPPQKLLCRPLLTVLLISIIIPTLLLILPTTATAEQLQSDNYTMDISIGQPVSGTADSDNYSICLGYQCLQDRAPPSITIVSPDEGEQFPSGTGSVDLEIQTDENATCKYDNSDVGYADMTGSFNTGDNTNHTASISTSSGQSYTYYIRCRDVAGNVNLVSAVVNFSVKEVAKPAAGGGGGGTTISMQAPTAVSIIAVDRQTLAEITGGTTGTLSFTKTEISEIRLAIKSYTTNVEVVISKLGGKPTDIADDPSGDVYSYLRIDAKNINYADMETAIIEFKVEKSWIDDNNVNPETIRLNRYASNKWNELSTTKVDDDSKYTYFEAESPGLSTFAITGEPDTATPTTATSANVLVQVTVKPGTISSGQSKTISLDKTDVSKISISVKNTVHNVEVTVQKLREKPVDITISPGGNVYSYMEIQAVNITDNDLNYVTLWFKVNKTWLREENVNQTTVKLSRYHGGMWSDLPTTRVEEETETISYKAVSPGLSTFAINGEKEPPTTIIPKAISEVPEKIKEIASDPMSMGILLFLGAVVTITLFRDRIPLKIR